ncbi:MAG TPA: hypothetical protein VFM68_03580 [Candidatus Saccharimonadales bacterium]|nr:hypothetical protein [Candidatus Saccharimonadales bacterium]
MADKSNRMRGVAKFVRNTVISVGVLLVVLVGGGVAYTWYMGQQPVENTPAVAAPIAPKPAPVIKASKPAPNAKPSASVQLLTTPVMPGENASINVKTLAAAKCTITVVYDEVPSKDSGLGPKVADEFGIISWAWTVEPTVPLGKWPVTVTCTYNKRPAVVQGMLEVVAEKE